MKKYKHLLISIVVMLLLFFTMRSQTAVILPLSTVGSHPNFSVNALLLFEKLGNSHAKDVLFFVYHEFYYGPPNTHFNAKSSRILRGHYIDGLKCRIAKGDVNALDALAREYLRYIDFEGKNEGNISELIALLKKGVTMDSKSAMIYLALANRDGVGIPVDYKVAEKLFLDGMDEAELKLVPKSSKAEIVKELMNRENDKQLVEKTPLGEYGPLSFVSFLIKWNGTMHDENLYPYLPNNDFDNDPFDVPEL